MSGAIEIKSAREIDAMRASCQMAAETLLLVGDKLRVGMTTEEINTLLHEDTVRRGATPSPLNYHGFPKSVCTSINEVVCHGIPGERVLLVVTHEPELFTDLVEHSWQLEQGQLRALS